MCEWDMSFLIGKMEVMIIPSSLCHLRINEYVNEALRAGFDTQ